MVSQITYTKDGDYISILLNEKCNYKCYGCITDYNNYDYHLDDYSPKDKEPINNDEVIKLLKDIKFNKVFFFGKEPFSNSGFPDLAKQIKNEYNSYNVVITNGTYYHKNISDFMDEICISIKAVSESIFTEYTGFVDKDLAISNLQKYNTHNKLVLRTESVFIPNLVDINELSLIAKKIATINPLINHRIDAYIPFIDDKKRRPTIDEMDNALIKSKKHLINTSILHSNSKALKKKVIEIY